LRALKILVDGRVFSTDAFNRGTGQYTAHLLSLKNNGHAVSLLLFDDLRLANDDAFPGDFNLQFCKLRPDFAFAGVPRDAGKDDQAFDAHIRELVGAERYDVYLDATPMVGPARSGNPPCAVIAVCYDFIPLKHQGFYLPSEPAQRCYRNGLARLAEADAVICISEQTRSEARHHLGIGSDRLFMIHPRIEESYIEDSGPSVASGQAYVFSILGSHLSKNPEAAAGILRQVVDAGTLSVRVNFPTKDQRDAMAAALARCTGLTVSAAIPSGEKHELQRGATVIAHLSSDEGFGLPFLEALFLRKKIIALDIPINRELLTKTTEPCSGCVLLVPPQSTTIDLGGLETFLREPPNERFYADVRRAFMDHWSDASRILASCIDTAARRHRSASTALHHPVAPHVDPTAASATWRAAIPSAVRTVGTAPGMRLLALSTPGGHCGIGDYNAELSVSLQAQGHDVDLIELVRIGDRTLPTGEFARRIAHYDAAIVQHEFSFFGDVHPHVMTNFTAVVRALRAARKPAIVFMHTDMLWMPPRPMLRPWSAAARNRAARRAMIDEINRTPHLRLLVHAEKSRQDWIGIGVAPERIATITFAMRPAGLALEPRPLSEADTVELVMFGFLVEYKGYEVALKAMRVLPENYRLTIAGEVPQFDRNSRILDAILGFLHTGEWVSPQGYKAVTQILRPFAEAERQSMRKRVRITGYVPPSQIPHLMSRADIVLLPYRIGPPGSATLGTALAFGRPVVASGVDTFRNIAAQADCFRRWRSTPPMNWRRQSAPSRRISTNAVACSKPAVRSRRRTASMRWRSAARGC
jgi:glycosyltransferase involved in cell wall biosynthesis